ncbi:adenylate kinase-like protein [Rhizodiscina lignyota]|uniref:GTP:AMP phosphotransferase, mitochondrial n=1 Tax=Rhizodiscina lignyota TaxID=1504668 RepID=A0A9P4IF60_9PEZI|nr:adenylate kinase-like protein [Rhizodiscina lignyota]
MSRFLDNQVKKLSRAARVILVGAPGVGKGTQTERLMKRFPQLSAISSGDLLRDNVRNRTPLGIRAEAKMKSGDLVPDMMILRLILNELDKRGWVKRGPVVPYTLNYAAEDAAIEQAADEASILPTLPTESFHYSDAPSASFILDGFPRNAAQAAQIDKIVPINLVVNISTPTEIILDRICNRWVHAPSGRVYNTTFNAPKVPGKDDVTGEPLTRRPDDEPEVWKARLAKHEESSLSLLEHYDKKGVLWTVRGNSSNEISPKLYAEFERRFSEE